MDGREAAGLSSEPLHRVSGSLGAGVGGAVHGGEAEAGGPGACPGPCRHVGAPVWVLPMGGWGGHEGLTADPTETGFPRRPPLTHGTVSAGHAGAGWVRPPPSAAAGCGPRWASEWTEAKRWPLTVRRETSCTAVPELAAQDGGRWGGGGVDPGCLQVAAGVSQGVRREHGSQHVLRPRVWRPLPRGPGRVAWSRPRAPSLSGGPACVSRGCVRGGPRRGVRARPEMLLTRPRAQSWG